MFVDFAKKDLAQQKLKNKDTKAIQIQLIN